MLQYWKRPFISRTHQIAKVIIATNNLNKKIFRKYSRSQFKFFLAKVPSKIKQNAGYLNKNNKVYIITGASQLFIRCRQQANDRTIGNWLYSLLEDSLGDGDTTASELGAPHVSPHQLHLTTVLRRATVGRESSGNKAQYNE